MRMRMRLQRHTRLVWLQGAYELVLRGQTLTREVWPRKTTCEQTPQILSQTPWNHDYQMVKSLIKGTTNLLTGMLRAKGVFLGDGRHLNNYR